MTHKDLAEDEYSKIWLEGNVLCCSFKKPVLDMEIARSCVKLRLDVTKNKTYPIYIDISNIKSVTKDARDYFASEYATQNLIAAALQAGSFMSKMMGTFFLSFNKPRLPIRLFTDKEDALRWLHRYESGEE